MITLTQIKFWFKHRGNSSLPDRLREKDPLSYDEWLLIEDIVARLAIDQAGLSGVAFQGETDNQLTQLTASPEARDILRKVAAARTPN